MPDRERLAKKLLLIGWDAADWQMIEPLVDAGQMPVLNSLIERGVMGNLATLQPCLSPLLWTSIATGKFADKHGILGFVEPDGGDGVRLSSSVSRRTKALWNILSQNGLKTHVVGWYASHPAEPINGVCISNLFDQNPPPPDVAWPLPDDSVHPPKWRDPAREFRIRPTDLAATDMQFFIPSIGEIDLRTDRRPIELALALSHCVNVHSMATAILENEPWDFLAVYYDMLDVAGHHFMPYHPPQMDHVPPDDFERYQHVMARTYMFHDQMLGRLLQLAGDDATVMIVSDHGFYSDHRRPKTLVASDSPEALAATWHRQFGIVCAAGDHIKKDERVYGATLLDIAPTVLTLLGVAPAGDMDGKPLVQILEEPRKVEGIRSWDEVPGDAGMHPADLRAAATGSRETIERLIALGYLDASAADANAAQQTAIDEANFNLAMVYMNSSRPTNAVEVLSKLCETQPANARYRMTLANAFAQAKQYRDAIGVMSSLEAEGVASSDLDAAMAAAQLELGETDAALKRLLRARETYGTRLNIEHTLARIYSSRGALDEAEAAYRRMLDDDAESVHAHHGLAGVLLEKRDWENAASHALRALATAHYFPAAHVQLGQALEGMGMIDKAIQSLETAVDLAPGFAPAHKRLAAIFHRLGDPARALKHERGADGLGDF